MRMIDRATRGPNPVNGSTGQIKLITQIGCALRAITQKPTCRDISDRVRPEGNHADVNAKHQ